MPTDFFIGCKFAYNCYYYFNIWCVELEYLTQDSLVHHSPSIAC